MDENYHIVNRCRVLRGIQDPVWACDTLPIDDLIINTELPERFSQDPQISLTEPIEGSIPADDNVEALDKNIPIIYPLDRIYKQSGSTSSHTALHNWVDTAVENAVTQLRKL